MFNELYLLDHVARFFFLWYQKNMISSKGVFYDFWGILN